MDLAALIKEVLRFETEMKNYFKGLQLRRNCMLLCMAALLNSFQLMNHSVNLLYL